ncbi:hypothetical protein LOTGIDRAFT_139855 [Lottia gigantea]|uniref:Enoyl reductase (ER) domain-containing protein n=1 Tax=Lottia gigantea TaxID=225164 RepID=V4CGE7_LOTGI|nr:hypothetical protein LOTGIDRAFT_139855 [Lottia gigantea]ESP01155.1 hypothetical protein LOTGIDRAFT_139855 [Lottia gigantea]
MSVNYCTSVGEKTTYKAAVCFDYKKPLVIQEKKKPTRLSKGQVLVAIEAAGINFSDILMCKGLYQVKPPLPFTAGSEICGYVEDIGESVSNVQKGDKVIGILSNYGGFAEYGVFHKSTLFKLPEALSTVQGAGTIISYGTAMMALGRRAQLQKGETVLITAAAGATGLAAVDIASHVFGAKVIGLCGSEKKCHLIKERGVSHAIDYNTEDVRGRIKEITGGKGVNVVMDQVGGDIFLQCLKSVAEEGRILTVGYASGTIPNIPANLLLLKSCTVMGLFWGNYSQTNPSAFTQSILDVTRAINHGDIYPHVGATFSLSQINAGFSYVENRKSTGKVIITTMDGAKSML